MKRIIAVLLMLSLLLSLSLVSGTALTAEQETFLSKIIALAIEDMKVSNILASVTIAQGIVESAWGQSKVAKEAQNYFGIKAYATSWTGPVYCYITDKHFTSLQDLMASDKTTYNKYINDFYRVYNSLEESVTDHGILLSTYARYSKIPGNTNYEEVCDLLLETGYCGEPNYPATLKLIIQQRQLYIYDKMEANAEVSRITLDASSLNLKIGDEQKLTATIVPLNAADKTVTFQSSDTSIATVTQEGIVKAISAGMATITATSSNGLTASAVVYCTSTGTIAYTGVIINNVNCRSTPDTSSIIYGVLMKGTEVVIYGNQTGGWYLLSGKASSGSMLHGYVYSTYVEITGVYDPDSGTTPINPPDTSEEPETSQEPEPEPEPEPTKPDNAEKYRVGVIINSDLNIRSGPGASNTLLGTFTKGVEIIVIGDATENNWYRVIGLAQGNRIVEGWCGGAYIDIKHSLLTSRTTLGKNTYVNQAGLFHGVPAGTTIQTLKNTYDHISITVKDAEGNIRDESDTLASNDTVIAFFNNITVFTAKAVVKGDASCDGGITPFDYFVLRVLCLDSSQATDVQIAACDLNNDGEITAIDYFILRQYILGNIESF